ncbi:MAG: hypothetical protein GX219_06220 [Tissierellia bacterium]|nr:hypothetical protein [Tissierellia bacterium]
MEINEITKKIAQEIDVIEDASNGQVLSVTNIEKSMEELVSKSEDLVESVSAFSVN